jgi:hypothetical protein
MRERGSRRAMARIVGVETFLAVDVALVRVRSVLVLE